MNQILIKIMHIILDIIMVKREKEKIINVIVVHII